MKPQHICSWNVNGLKAILRKNFHDFIKEYQPEVLCLQETKSHDEEVQRLLGVFDQFHIYSNSADKKGYSGTAVMSRSKALSFSYGIGIPEYDHEGRVITLEFPEFYLVNVYVPNSGNGLKRLDYRSQWDVAFRQHLVGLSETKAVIVTGDFNVAHQEIDIARPKQNYNKSAGYTQREIDGFSELLQSGFTDTFRALNPGKVVYTYWSYRAQARPRNVGWRLDYFLADKKLWDNVKDVRIHTEVEGSDHCPLSLIIQ